jgi:hypothetical protein
MKNTSTVLWDVAPYSVHSFETYVHFYQTTQKHSPENDTITRLHGSHVIMRVKILPLATS